MTAGKNRVKRTETARQRANGAKSVRWVATRLEGDYRGVTTFVERLSVPPEPWFWAAGNDGGYKKTAAAAMRAAERAAKRMVKP